jgi:DNA polymerase-3 subunit epsilon
MRQVVLDTETTGLEPAHGHRIIEIGCVEILHRRITERRYQQYLNPEREVDAGAADVHGITLADLTEKPAFRDIVGELIDFVRGAELVIHNAAFDVGFLNAELAQAGADWGRIEDYCTVFDTLQLAREMHPGQRNNLDALCRRYSVDNAHRERHGALLDAELLAEVYLAMTGGQATLELGSDARQRVRAARAPATHALRVVLPSADEVAAHERMLGRLKLPDAAATLWSAAD